MILFFLQLYCMIWCQMCTNMFRTIEMSVLLVYETCVTDQVYTNRYVNAVKVLYSTIWLPTRLPALPWKFCIHSDLFNLYQTSVLICRNSRTWSTITVFYIKLLTFIMVECVISVYFNNIEAILCNFLKFGALRMFTYIAKMAKHTTGLPGRFRLGHSCYTRGTGVANEQRVFYPRVVLN
jgi:hypothetical protein